MSSKLPFSAAVPACIFFATMLAAAGPASADSDLPLRFILSGILLHDDNVFRQATAPIADTTTTTNVGFILDKTLSRQSFHAEVTGSANRYQRLSILNNDGSRLLANWQGSFPGRFGANARVSRTEAMSSFADLGITKKNIVTTTESGGGVSYAVHPDLSFTADIGHISYRNSATINAPSDADVDSSQVGLLYVSALGNSIGFAAIRSNGHYLRVVNSDYQQKDLQFNLKWKPGFKSSLGFHAGRTEREQKNLLQQNFSGNTGELTFDWANGNKTSFNAYVSRVVAPQNSGLATYALVRRAGLGVIYALTSKISTSLVYDRQQRVFGGVPSFVVSLFGEPTDTFSTTGLSLTYSPIDKIKLSMQMRHEERHSNDPIFSSSYKDNIGMFSAQMSY